MEPPQANPHFDASQLSGKHASAAQDKGGRCDKGGVEVPGVGRFADNRLAEARPFKSLAGMAWLAVRGPGRVLAGMLGPAK